MNLLIKDLFPKMGRKKDKKKQVQERREERKKQKQQFKRMRKKMGKGDSFKLTRQYMQYYEKFDKQLEVLRLKLKDVAGDGNCLFRSMGDQLDGTENTHLFLREQACKYILNNEQFFKNFIDEDQQGTIYQYVQGMRKDGEWGGHLQLQALCQCLKCIIIVHKINHEEYYVTPIMTQSNGILVHLAYFQHQDFQHYLSLRDIDDNSKDPGMLKLKALNKNMYQHLLQFQDPQQLALMKQIQQIQLNQKNYNNKKQEDEQQQYNYEQEQEIKQPYPGLPANKKCQCGSNNTYKNCCLKQYHKKMAGKGYY